MAQRGDCARLLLETPQPFRVSRERRRHHLDGDIAAQAQVACLIHLAHAACADKFNDFIGAKVGSGRKTHGMSPIIATCSAGVEG